MLMEREILNIQQFYSDEGALALLEAAMYFQKMLILQFQCEDTSLQMTNAPEGICYVVSAKLPVNAESRGIPDEYEEVLTNYVHLIVYEDCVNVQFSTRREFLDPDFEELLARKISMLVNRSNYLKEIEAAADEVMFNCYLWVNVGREYTNNRTIDSIMKEFMWMSDELNKYLLDHAVRSL